MAATAIVPSAYSLLALSTKHNKHFLVLYYLANFFYFLVGGLQQKLYSGQTYVIDEHPQMLETGKPSTYLVCYPHIPSPPSLSLCHIWKDIGLRD